MPVLFLLCLIMNFSAPAFAAESIRSMDAAESEASIIHFKPGYIIIFPDGSRSTIKEELQDGTFVTDSGYIISPGGMILEGPNAGEIVVLSEESKKAAVISENEEHHRLSETRKTTQEDKSTLSETRNQEAAVIKESEAAKSGDEDAAAQASSQSGTITIADLLPTTPNPQEEQLQVEPDAKILSGKTKPPVKGKEESKASATSGKEKDKSGSAQTRKTEAGEAKSKKSEHKTEQKKESGNASSKVAPGQEMRIPEAAIKTGNLDFLEGCWQGTRPEYYSKRTIKECFCFGKNGKSGKRRVIDPTYNRKCIGSSRASLNQSGVLFVVSSGAACTDGERWGQAEMTCRNSGPRTPCSWIFRDAQNGQQAYQIPFIRVTSCGR